MTFFEQELRRIVKHCDAIHCARFVGRECIARLTDDVTVKLSFRSMKIADHYDALQIRLLNRRDGEIDTQMLRLSDVWGKVTMRGRNEPIEPYAWTYQDETNWYGFQPNEMQFDLLSRSVDAYLECFTEPEQTEEPDISMQ